MGFKTCLRQPLQYEWMILYIFTSPSSAELKHRITAYESIFSNI